MWDTPERGAAREDHVRHFACEAHANPRVHCANAENGRHGDATYVKGHMDRIKSQNPSKWKNARTRGELGRYGDPREKFRLHRFLQQKTSSGAVGAQVSLDQQLVALHRNKRNGSRSDASNSNVKEAEHFV